MSHPAPNSNRNRIQPTPRVTPTKQTKALIISNRESLRLEIDVTPTKQRPAPGSNREKEARFSVGEGVYLPPGLGLGVAWGLGVGWDSGGMRGTSDIQNSNREGRRLEAGVKLTNQRIRVSSNRQKEAPFFGPSRGGSFLPDPPAFRPPLSRRVPRLNQETTFKVVRAARPIPIC
jgi:hypothetical protein